MKCSKCESEYFLSGELCLQVSKVENCKEYALAEDKCLSCEDGFLHDQNRCLSIPKVEFCSKFQVQDTSVICSECNDHTFLNQDNICIRRVYSLAMIPHCDALKDASDQCQGCADGYGLSADGLVCLEKVTNCADQALANDQTGHFRCNSCDENFTLDLDANVCYQALDGCVGYDASFENCTKCENATHFLGHDKRCASRSVLPADCQEFEPTEDKCSMCREGFRLTGDMMHCLESISFCSVANDLF
ncbi:MAG: hypothetical protein AAFO91_00010 [Bacteroidota bacterium]